MRAGVASVKAAQIYGAKKDANHDEIVSYMGQRIPVIDMSWKGYGAPDGVAEVNGRWVLFEIKNLNTTYGRRGLNRLQRAWAKSWKGGPVFILNTVGDADLFVHGRFEELERFPKEGFLV